MVRKSVHYSGRVQGVGFRFTTRRIASGYAVTGFVRNLPDGRVQVVVEGERKEVSSFLADLGSQMSGYIHSTDISDLDATGEFQDFRIRY